MNSRMKKNLWKDIKESIPAYILIAPTITVLIIFLYIPFMNAIRISTYKFNGIGDLVDYVGLNNYLEILKNHKFYTAFYNTFKLIAADLIFSLAIAFGLAYILYKGIKFKNIFNTALFIPYLISMVVVGSIWTIIYDPNIGPLNQILELIGLKNLAQPWLSKSSTALPAIIVTWIWRTIPFNMLILYANIMTLPGDYLEAAELDGATTFQKLKFIIIPYLMPTFSVLAMLTVTSDLRAFDMVWIMTQGGPGGASEVITSFIYREAFTSQKFGTATAASIITMIIMITFTVVIKLTGKKKEE